MSTGSVAVRFDRVYGRITCYPANATAEIITRLTGKKTLGPKDIESVKMLGYDVVVDQASMQMLREFIGGEA